MLVTERPPSEDGMERSPDAGDAPVTVAVFPLVEYDHVIPFTVSVRAAEEKGRRNTARAGRRIVRFMGKLSKEEC